MDMMIDVETLATCPNAAIVSIGGVKYDIEKKIMQDEFYVNINAHDCKRYGLVIDPETVAWWKNQDATVRQTWMKDPLPLKEAMGLFYNWVDPSSSLSCYGMSFDVPIIQSALLAVGYKKMPWHYRKLRCARTIGELYDVRPKNDANKMHNALEDAKAQVRMLFDIFS